MSMIFGKPLETASGFTATRCFQDDNRHLATVLDGSGKTETECLAEHRQN